MVANRGKNWLRYGVPGVLLGLALAGIQEGRGPVSAQGLPQLPLVSPATTTDRSRTQSAPATAIDAGSGTLALTIPGLGNSQLLTLVDTRSKAFAIYRIDPSAGKGTVKLEAVRQYQWDLKLAEYNNLPPEVAAIESSVKSLGAGNR